MSIPPPSSAAPLHPALAPRQGSPPPPPLSSKIMNFMPEGYEPGKYDVLCGRGKSALNHVGNRRFRTIVAVNLENYLALKSRSDKTHLAMRIVLAVRDAGGQFLKQDPLTQRLYDIGDKMAREKVAHALRDAKADRSMKRRRHPQDGPEGQDATGPMDSKTFAYTTQADVAEAGTSVPPLAAPGMAVSSSQTTTATPTSAIKLEGQEQGGEPKAEASSDLTQPQGQQREQLGESSRNIAHILLHLSMSRPGMSSQQQSLVSA
mmetsp:Transcript_24423/g.56907  ORF Transcript_24423/g.56907 Transcript_24423/m.56907 type:complete len:262 (+) Transcript_24423:101-886(+)|eukprot:CAMPEP_0116836382 /NCGR_PEP_ID=MMETSP0418-20121206/8067_1 /TAXON_ID=1158023 /ORGANISM="Astrosyne radiata, Strain 13vi08-1A" /LENGTH=261 /DNA_ID=CAMNT_0004466149 /DNA_START=83 /DNA_END=868 /DNA_ORIENTATION=+